VEDAGNSHGVYPSWFVSWVDAEQRAAVLQTWEPLIAPGLLQTAGYACAIFEAWQPVDDEPMAAQGVRSGIKDTANRRSDPWRPGTGGISSKARLTASVTMHEPCSPPPDTTPGNGPSIWLRAPKLARVSGRRAFRRRGQPRAGSRASACTPAGGSMADDLTEELLREVRTRHPGASSAACCKELGDVMVADPAAKTATFPADVARRDVRGAGALTGPPCRRPATSCPATRAGHRKRPGWDRGRGIR
jgi:uncharacterized protein DUF5753